MIENLYQKIIEASGLDVDRKWKPWAKYIDSIDLAKKGGYMFVGDMIYDQTLEYKPEARLILACARYGSRKYSQNYYRLVLLHQSGDAEAVGEEVSDEDRGWALVIRPEVERHLKAISSHAEHAKDNGKRCALETAHDVMVAVLCLLKDHRFLEVCRSIDPPSAEALDCADDQELPKVIWKICEEYSEN